MKKLYWIFAFALVVLRQGYAQDSISGAVAPNVAGEYNVIERGLDYAVSEKTEIEVIEGEEREVKRRFTTLATGMHREQGGELIPCSPEIEVHAPNGAVAQKTRHKLIFSPNANNWDGAVDLLTPDNKRFRSRVLGIAYFDTATGESVLVAELKDSVGMLFPPDTIVYQDAFTDLKADLEYQNRLSGFEQNLIFREQPPTPAKFGLNDETTYIQLLTEFFAPPVPVKRTVVRDGMPDDRVLDFGGMKIPVGKSFLVGQERDGVSVDKQWKQLEGRDFLIEQIPYAKVEVMLQTLPEKQEASNTTGNSKQASKELRLPQRTAQIRDAGETVLVASAARKREGFVLDYSTVQSQTTDFTFQADTTYYISQQVNLEGAVTFEGGTVIKFNTPSYLALHGPVKCLTGPYRPAVFTSVNDDTVGEVLPASDHSPARGDYGVPMYLLNHGEPTVLEYLRISYASQAFEFDNYPTANVLLHSQIRETHYGAALLGVDLRMRNVLFSGVGAAVYAIENPVVGEHVTFHNVNTLCLTEDGLDPGVYMTNSLLVAVTNMGVQTYTLQNCYWTQTHTPDVFQTVGAGAYYLRDGSVHRNSGTENINASLAADLKKLTTYPPVVFSAQSAELILKSDLALRPIANRDTDAFDLGYHYPPIDFAFGYSSITNADVTVQPGTVIGTFNHASTQTFGLRISMKASLDVLGTPTKPVWIVRYNTVQEGAASSWAGAPSPSIYTPINTYATPPPIVFRFCNFSVLANETRHFYANVGSIPTVKFRDCEFAGGEVLSFRPSLTMTNCLFERTKLTVDSGTFTDTALQFHNNLFWWNTVTISNRLTANTWGFTNNLFYRSTIFTNGIIRGDFNGYITGSNTVPVAAGDEIVSEVPFEAGDLGRFYQASTSGMLGQGSTTADLLGLYHYTTASSNVKEGSSQVDIGFHYMALSSGSPSDIDGDLLADYLEDVNGDGIRQSSETKWQTDGAGDPKNTDGDLVDDYGEWLQGSNGSIGSPTSFDLNLRVNTPLQ